MADPHRILTLLRDLKAQLEAIVARDSEQEVRGMALPVLDAVIAEARTIFPNDSVVEAVNDVVSVETISEGEPIRAVDALLVVTSLHGVVNNVYGRSHRS